MNDEALKDIGISRATAIHEANRHFWDTQTIEDGVDQNELPSELNLKYN